MTELRRARLRRVASSIVDGPFGSNLASEHYVDDGARVVRLGNIGSMSFNNDDRAFIEIRHFERLRRHEVLAGDLLVAGLGDSGHAVGRTCIAPTGLGPAIVKADCFRLRVREDLVDQRFVAWFMNSTDAEHQIALSSRGATRARATPDVIIETAIPLFKLNYQRRIADFLDDQIARIDNIVAAREKQSQLLDLAWQEGLDAILAGHDDRQPRLARFARVQTGVTVDAGRKVSDGAIVPYLRVANVQAGSLALTEIKEIELDRAQLARCTLRDGDVLMTEGGDIDKLGRGTVWRSQLAGLVAHQNHVFAVRVDQDSLLPEFLASVTSSTSARRYFELTATKTTNLASTSASKVLDLRIPYVSIVRQHVAVDELDRLKNEISELRGGFVGSGILLNELKRSLITAAVTGEFDVTSADGSQVPV